MFRLMHNVLPPFFLGGGGGGRQPLYAKRKLHVSHLTNDVAWIIVSHVQCHSKQCLKLVKPAA